VTFVSRDCEDHSAKMHLEAGLEVLLCVEIHLLSRAEQNQASVAE
jgi:hypothetical protein